MITRGRGSVWSRPKYDHEILEQPLMLPDISLQQSEILGLEAGHDTSGHQGVVVRVEQEDHRQEEHKGVVKL